MVRLAARPSTLYVAGWNQDPAPGDVRPAVAGEETRGEGTRLPQGASFSIISVPVGDLARDGNGS